MRPISSRVRIMLALCLAKTGTPAGQSVDAATHLISLLRSRGFDIVHNDWIDGAAQGSDPMRWEDIASMAEKIERDSGRKPWLP